MVVAPLKAIFYIQFFKFLESFIVDSMFVFKGA